MDYKELIERLNAYSAEHQCHGGITAEAADAIKTLLAERDAAVEGLSYFTPCSACVHSDDYNNGKPCEFSTDCTYGQYWEWRGPQKESDAK